MNVADRHGIADDRVGQCDERTDRTEVDGPARRIDGIGVGILRLEGRSRALAHVGQQRFVRFEEDELGAEFRPHRGERCARVHAQSREGAPAELDVLIRVVAIRPGDVEKQILRRYAGR